MGQQQILLIVLSIILVGISVSVGITMFKSYALTANQDAIIYDIINIASDAYQYRLKPSMLGGGNGTFKDFKLANGFGNNANAKYEVRVLQNGQVIEVIGKSNSYNGATVAAYYDLNLKIIDDPSSIEGVNVESTGGVQTGFRLNGWGNASH